jgi:hypothetical protein
MFALHIVLCFTLLLNPAPIPDIGDKAIAAIRAGNAKELSNYFHTTVDLTVLGKEGLYSKIQAEQILRDFFIRHPPVSYTPREKPSDKANSNYGIGIYQAKGIKNFKIYFLIRKIGNQSFIQQLTIEPENP